MPSHDADQVPAPGPAPKVRADVIKATNEQQVRWDRSSPTGELYFKPGS